LTCGADPCLLPASTPPTFTTPADSPSRLHQSNNMVAPTSPGVALASTAVIQAAAGAYAFFTGGFASSWTYPFLTCMSLTLPAMATFPVVRAEMIKHWKDLNWPMGIYITLVHVLAFVGWFYITSCKWQTLLWAFILWPITGLGITAGVHRLWSHRSYSAGLPLRIFLMLANSIANQGSILHWARDHRVHHKHSETPADPHNALRGFFFAHMGWLYVKKDKRVKDAGLKMNFDDLYRDPVVMIQKKLDPFFALFMCFIFPGLISQMWGDNFWNGFWVAGCFRYAVVLHFTWLVNSAAHLYGSRPYDPKSNPAENGLVSIASIGEGWHNWHHAYPFDYSASELGVSRQFNPTKLFIDTCVALGLAWDTKRALGVWKMRQNKFEKSGKAVPIVGPPLFERRVLYTAA
jgi:stearoyl-CoA desaturase (delta-9 desaturase)